MCSGTTSIPDKTTGVSCLPLLSLLLTGKHTGHSLLPHPRLPSDLNLASKDPATVDFIGNIGKAIAKAKVCFQAAQQR